MLYLLSNMIRKILVKRCFITLFCAVFSPLGLSADSEATGSNLQIGELELDLRGDLSLSYNSNIGRSPNDPESDWITGVGLSLSGDLELTEINTLNLSIGAQYRKYWKNPEYDSNRNSIILTPDTSLELLVQAGNFDFRVYDEFSLLSDPGDQRFIDPDSGAELANIVLYSRINNQLGVDGIWTINPYWSANAGLSRLDIIPLDDDFSDLERYRYNASVGLTHYMAANFDVNGLLSASIDRWRTELQPDSSSWTAGVGADWRATDFLELDIFVSWTHRSFADNGSNGDPIRESQGLSGNIGLVHLINADLEHSIRYFRSIDLGTVSNEIASQAVEYRIDYAGFERSDIFLAIFWNDGVESGDFSAESYDRWTFRCGLGYPLSKRLDFSVTLEHSFRDSNVSNRNFSQNNLSLSLKYDF